MALRQRSRSFGSVAVEELDHSLQPDGFGRNHIQRQTDSGKKRFSFMRAHSGRAAEAREEAAASAPVERNKIGELKQTKKAEFVPLSKDRTHSETFRRNASTGELVEVGKSAKNSVNTLLPDGMQSDSPPHTLETLAARDLYHASELNSFWQECLPERGEHPRSSRPSHTDAFSANARRKSEADQYSETPSSRDSTFADDTEDIDTSGETPEQDFVFDADLFKFTPASPRFAISDVIKEAVVNDAVRRANARIAKFRAVGPRASEQIKRQRRRLDRAMTAPVFLRTSDKIVFTLGVLCLLVTEGVMFLRPDLMATWYATVMTTLLLVRAYQYTVANFQFFLLDFCYFVQFAVAAFLYLWPSSRLFKVCFILCTGPLAMAVPMWRNSLGWFYELFILIVFLLGFVAASPEQKVFFLMPVTLASMPLSDPWRNSWELFHDLDKMTSVLLHMFPPLVLYVLRWFPTKFGLDSICGTTAAHCHLDSGAFVDAVVVYGIWQALYVVATEIVWREAIARYGLMTSLRWLTERRPHPIYRYIRARGIKTNAVVILIACQLIFTVVAILPTRWFFESFILHSGYISLIFLSAIWNGANFYFEVFTEQYAKRFKRHLREGTEETVSAARGPTVAPTAVAN